MESAVEDRDLFGLRETTQINEVSLVVFCPIKPKLKDMKPTGTVV